MVAEKDYIEIPLGGKKFPGRVALIDAEDADLVNKASWRTVVTHRHWRQRGNLVITEYASAYNRSNVYDGFPKYLYLHRVLMGVTDRRIHIDHINHNGLDCRKSNMRLVTHQENQFNRRPTRGTSSLFKGVSWLKRERKWVSKIHHNDQAIVLGIFDLEIDAAIAYDNAAMELFGDFAYLNFPTRRVS